MTHFPIIRNLPAGAYGIKEVFPRIGACAILADIFGSEPITAAILERTVVHLIDYKHEMYVDNDDGSIAIGLSYLHHATHEYLYLDIVHELCHVKQHLDARNLYDRTKSYVDRETEIEAYEITVREARRIGLSEQAIADYLHVSWITAEEHKRLVGRLGVVIKATDDEAIP